MSRYQHTFVKTESTCGVYEVILDSYKPPKFRSGFVTAAKSLENADPETEAGYSAFKKFIEVYGTHYIYR